MTYLISGGGINCLFLSLPLSRYWWYISLSKGTRTSLFQRLCDPFLARLSILVGSPQTAIAISLIYTRPTVLRIHVYAIYILYKQHKHPCWYQWLWGLPSFDHSCFRDHKRPPLSPMAHRLSDTIASTWEPIRGHGAQSWWSMECRNVTRKQTASRTTSIQPLLHASSCWRLPRIQVSQSVCRMSCSWADLS